jgi:periplasmic divalent cation tolerance protein
MAVSKNHCIVVLVTAANQSEAAAIGRTLVEERLAACANLVGPIRSIYRWRDAVEDAAEYLLLIKTRAGLFEAVQQRVKQLHSYEVAEIVALDIQKGAAPYLDWVLQSTAGSPAAPRKR